MARPLTRLFVLAVGAGAVWYGRRQLAEGGGSATDFHSPPPATGDVTGQPESGPLEEIASPAPLEAPEEVEMPPAPPEEATTPTRAEQPSADEVLDQPHIQPLEPQPGADEPEIEPRGVPGVADEPPPTAFEDAHQEGWHDEELGKDPATVDQLESDPATEPDARLDAALEEAEELPEPSPEPEVAHPATESAHITRVVDDLLEGRRDDAEDEPIEDATLVEEDPDRGSS